MSTHTHTHTHPFLFLLSFSFASHHWISLVSSLPWSMIITATESYGAQGTKPSSGLASSSLHPIFSTRWQHSLPCPVNRESDNVAPSKDATKSPRISPARESASLKPWAGKFCLLFDYILSSTWTAGILVLLHQKSRHAGRSSGSSALYEP